NGSRMAGRSATALPAPSCRIGRRLCRSHRTTDRKTPSLRPLLRHHEPHRLARQPRLAPAALLAVELDETLPAPLLEQAVSGAHRDVGCRGYAVVLKCALEPVEVKVDRHVLEGGLRHDARDLVAVYLHAPDSFGTTNPLASLPSFRRSTARVYRSTCFAVCQP